MPNKLRKAIGAVKDKTSISLAKVSGTSFSHLDVAILKATTHEEIPVDERSIAEVLHLTVTSRTHAAACVRRLARRIRRTRNWVVAIKSLTVIYRILQEGDPLFAHEVLRATKRGAHLLNLCSFRDDSKTSPWDYTAYVRTFALYLHQRLECSLVGKLHSKAKSDYMQQQQQQQQQLQQQQGSLPRKKSLDSDMKPTVLLDKIVHWQRLLDKFLATRPTGPAKANRLVQISLYLLVRESFDLYRDISDGLALVLDSFFHLPQHYCVEAFHTCEKASKQFEELGAYYALCKNARIGRTSEYPSVQKISEALLKTLNEFLKDSTNLPGDKRGESLGNKGGKASPKNGTRTNIDPDVGEGEDDEDEDESNDLGFNSAMPSPSEEDTETGYDSGSEWQASEFGNEETNTSFSYSTSQEHNSIFDLLSDEGPLQLPPQSPPQDHITEAYQGEGTGWEMVLVESANNLANKLNSINPRLFDWSSIQLEGLDAQGSPSHQYNPFLQSESEISSVMHDVSFPPPTFSVQNPDQVSVPPEADPFSSSYCTSSQLRICP